MCAVSLSCAVIHSVGASFMMGRARGGQLDTLNPSEGAKSLAVQANHLPFSNYKSIGNGVSVSLDFTSTIIINHEQQCGMKISYRPPL